jgi:hypothetical protein
MTSTRTCTAWLGALLILAAACGDGGGPRCGNDRIEGDEICDGAELGPAPPSCLEEGFRGGTIACAQDCLSFDTSGCSSTATCGNSVIEFPEECDGALPAAADCTSRGFDRGTISCTESCTLDVRACVVDFCGDGARGGEEDCDGDDLGGAGCTDLGFSGGDLGCRRDCTFDLTGCSDGCGNGTIDGDDTCDGPDTGGRTCVDEGFYTGVLACREDCAGFDTAGCEDDSAACTVDGTSLGEVGIGDALRVEGTTTGASDDVELSCQFVVPLPTADVAFELAILQRGRLHVQSESAWHVVGLMAEPDDASGCFLSEVACSNPFYAGNFLDLGNVDPGRYYLVVSDWSDVSRSFDLVLSLGEPDGEICSNLVDDDWDGDVDCADADCGSSLLCSAETSCGNGVDDDLDRHADCADTDCAGAAECTGTTCVADTDLGALVPYTPAGTSLDVSAETDDLTLPCSSSNGPDHVMGFTLTAEARVLVDFDQEASTAHAVALALPAGPTGGCTDAVYRCIDLSGSTETPDLIGWFSVEPFPAGDYFLVVEGTASGAGSVSTHVTAFDAVETVCDDGVDNDADGDEDCEDTECIATPACSGSACPEDVDLGTLHAGDSVHHEADVSGAGSTLNLSCAPTNGADVVLSFTLDGPVYVWLEADQAPGTGHAVALALQGGPGTPCDAVEHICLDLTDVDEEPDAFGYLTVPARLPAGTYYLIVEGTGTAGTVGITLSAAATTLETDCGNGVDDDADGLVDCDDAQCRADAGCRASGLYEIFEAGGADEFDLAGTMLTLTPVEGHPEGHVWSLREHPGLYPLEPGSGESSRSLALGDNERVEVPLPLERDHFGEGHDELNVWSNGILTLGPASSVMGFVESADDLFAAPSVAILWDDLDPGAGGSVTYDELPDRVAVAFDSVPEVDPATFEAVGSNSFQAVLWNDGHIDLAWLDVTCADGLVGVGDGSAIVSIPPETDFR